MWIRWTEVSGSIGRRRRKVVCQQNQLFLLRVKLSSLTPPESEGYTCIFVFTLDPSECHFLSNYIQVSFSTANASRFWSTSICFSLSLLFSYFDYFQSF